MGASGSISGQGLLISKGPFGLDDDRRPPRNLSFFTSKRIEIGIGIGIGIEFIIMERKFFSKNLVGYKGEDSQDHIPWKI